MDSILQQITDWLKEMLVSAIMGNLSGMFESVNNQVGEIATSVGMTPANFSPGVFAMVRNISESVIIPIAGLILTFIACYELIQMIIDHNNLANFETWIFFKWVFKTFVAVMLITNTFNITMAVFDVAQHVINASAGIISGNTAIDASALETMEETLMAMDLGPLLGLFLQSFIVQVTMSALAIIIFVIVYGRMIEIYLMVSLAPIPLSTFGNREQSNIGQNYLRSLFAIGFQGFLIMICVGIYAVLIQSMFHMGDNDKFFFDWKYLVESGLSVKDFIAPTAFAFKTNRTFQMGSIFGSMSYLAITASDLSDRMLADFLDMESTQIVTMHIQSVDQTAAIKTIKRTITELDRSKIEEQKKAVRSGYDMDIIPSDLATYGKDAKSLLKELQSQNERMFMVTFLVLNTGRTEQELENNVFQAQSIAQKHNCNLRRLDFQQESGLMSSLPLAQNLIEIRRGLTTSSTAIFVPFTTQELFQNGGETLYYGLNALSNNLIMVDRKKLKNPNGLILGTPGSGKSFSAKREITNAFLVTDDDIIICDPEAEYAALVHKFNGQVVKISSSSTNYINPMDINLNYSEDDNPVALKADFILSLCELIMGSKDGLQPIEKTVIDRCVHQIYQRYFDNPAPENMPILEDLYDALLKQDEKEAHHVATALEIYVKGSLKLFNNRTNVDIQNRLVCFDIKELGNQLKKIGMLIVQDQVWGRVTANRSAGKSTRYYIDEFHLLLKEEQTATYSVEIWKRFRKWGGLPTGITQNVKDLLRSPEIANILENSDFIYMLNQASDDRSILAQRLNISPHQLSYVTNSGEGEGLLFYGNVILPFIDRFPTDLELYRIMTTKLNEVAQEKEA